MRTGMRKLVTCSIPVVSGVMSVTSPPFISPASRFCKFGSTYCACAELAASATTAAARRRANIPPGLQLTCRNSELQQSLGVAAQDLCAIVGPERHLIHPPHAGRIRHERIVDREEDAVD